MVGRTDPAVNYHFQREADSFLGFPSVKEVASILLCCFLHFPSLVFLACWELYSDFCVCAELEVLEGSAYQSCKETRFCSGLFCTESAPGYVSIAALEPNNLLWL